MTLAPEAPAQEVEATSSIELESPAGVSTPAAARPGSTGEDGSPSDGRASEDGGTAVEIRPKPARRADIQGLRAVAVALVVADHVGLRGVPGGFVGVDVFFVISGYLITRQLLREAWGTGRVRLAHFYARRARRILPAATAVIIAILGVAAATQSFADLGDIGHDALWSSFFLANVHFASVGTDYFAAHAGASPFQHYWSLAVEEQFYLVWPLLVAVLAPRIPRWALFVVTLSIVAASVAWSVQLTSSDPTVAYFSAPARAYEFGLGALLAIAQLRMPGSARALLGFTGLGLIAHAVLTLNASSPFPGWHAVEPAWGAVCLLASGAGPVARLLSTAPMRGLGAISFSVYLWHWPVLQLGPDLAPKYVPPWAVQPWALIVITLLLSIATYWLVERPFQWPRLPFTSGRRGLMLWPFAVGLVLAAVAETGVYAQSAMAADAHRAQKWYDTHDVAPPPPTVAEQLAAGVDQARENAPMPPTLALDRVRADIWHNAYPCAAPGRAVVPPACVEGDTTATRTVVLLGDSHAGQWLPALDRLGQRDHYKVIPLVKSACAPFDVPQTIDGKPFGSCPQFRTWALAKIAELHPDAIVVGDRGLSGIVPPQGQTEEQAWSAGVAATVTRLVPLAPKVEVISDLPVRTSVAYECLTTQGNTQGSCLAQVAGEGIRSNSLTQAAMAGTGAVYVDAVPLVCAPDGCPAVADDKPVYFDDNHLTTTWARHVYDELGKLLGPLVG